MFTCIFKGHGFRSLALGGRGACHSALQRVRQFPRGTKAKLRCLGMLQRKTSRSVDFSDCEEETSASVLSKYHKCWRPLLDLVQKIGLMSSRKARPEPILINLKWYHQSASCPSLLSYIWQSYWVRNQLHAIIIPMQEQFYIRDLHTDSQSLKMYLF